MSDTQNTPLAIEEAAIKIAADNMIRQAAAKNNMTFEQVPEQAKQDAYAYAKASIEADQALKANPLYTQLQAEREAHKLTQAQLEAVKQTRIAPNNDVKPVADVSRVRGLMGENSWMALTDNGRLAACGIPPASVTSVELTEAKKIFGRGCDSHYSSNAFKQDAGRYRHLKNIAIILGLQG